MSLLKKLSLFSIYLLLPLHSLEAKSSKDPVNFEGKSLDFNINLKKLSQGLNQFSNTNYTDKKMRKFRKSEDKRSAISVFHYTYITAKKDIDFFTSKRLTAVHISKPYLLEGLKVEPLTFKG